MTKKMDLSERVSHALGFLMQPTPAGHKPASPETQRGGHAPLPCELARWETDGGRVAAVPFDSGMILWGPFRQRRRRAARSAPVLEEANAW
jgi:hypothetical protein